MSWYENLLINPLCLIILLVILTLIGIFNDFNCLLFVDFMLDKDKNQLLSYQLFYDLSLLFAPNCH